eukprot:TRINITY_DN3085_c0_g1_i2.p1 TRINITY_DN3085_c0_g1~~TRINITY_DN3085_c0_g1_i2.p1  ORF type:complete len:909 (-),score=100.78 TRINITY_DN3085_c0_g1_i2:5926-8652(-)
MNYKKLRKCTQSAKTRRKPKLRPINGTSPNTSLRQKVQRIIMQLEKLRLEILAHYQQRSAPKIEAKGNEKLSAVKEEVNKLKREVQDIKNQLRHEKEGLEDTARELVKSKEEKVRLEKDRSELAELNSQLQDELLKKKAKYDEETQAWMKKLQDLENEEVVMKQKTEDKLNKSPKEPSPAPTPERTMKKIVPVAAPKEEIEWNNTPDDLESIFNEVEHKQAPVPPISNGVKHAFAAMPQKAPTKLPLGNGIFIPKPKPQQQQLKGIGVSLCYTHQLHNNNQLKQQNMSKSPKHRISSLRRLKRLMDPVPMNESEWKASIEAPQKGVKKLMKMNENIDKQFNQMWFHLYKTMNDIEARKLGLSSPERLQESIALTNYAKKASRFLAHRAEGDLAEEDPDEKTLRAAESVVKKVDPELERVVFLESMKEQQPRNKNLYDFDENNASPTKYRRWVLKSCGIKDEEYESLIEEVKSTTTRTLNKQPTSTTVDKEVPPKPLLLKKEVALKRVKLRREKSYKEEPVSVTKNFPFNIEIEEPKSVLSMSNPSIQFNTPKRKRHKLPIIENTPLTQHARSVVRISPQPHKNDDAAYKASIKAFAAQIYGKKRGAFPMPKLNKGKIAVLSTPLLKKSDKRPKKRDNFFITSASPLKKIQLLSSFSNSTKSTRPEGSVLENASRESPSKFDKLLETCTFAQLKAEKDIEEIQTTGKKLRGKLHQINRILNNGEIDKEQRQNRKYIKYFKQTKHLFIYGKKGLGRFLSQDGKDVVRACDQITKLDPKYPFMHSKLGSVFTNSDINSIQCSFINKFSVIKVITISLIKSKDDTICQKWLNYNEVCSEQANIEQVQRRLRGIFGTTTGKRTKILRRGAKTGQYRGRQGRSSKEHCTNKLLGEIHFVQRTPVNSGSRPSTKV